MPVSFARAVHPTVGVPLQVVGTHLVDELRQTTKHPRARSGIGETDLRVECVLVADAGVVLASVRGEESLLGEPVPSDGAEGHALGLDPDAQFDAPLARIVPERAQSRREPLRVHFPRPEAVGEIELAGGLPARYQPASTCNSSIPISEEKSMSRCSLCSVMWIP